MKHNLPSLMLSSLVLVGVTTANWERSLAQSPPPSPAPASSPSPAPTPPPNRLTPQERDDVEQVVEHEIRTSGAMRDQVQSEVQSTFGWTVSLLNLLIAVLIAVPGAAGLIVFLLRRTLLNELTVAIRAELQPVIDAELKQKLRESERTIEIELQQQLEIAKQKLAELQDFLEKKDLLVDQIAEFSKLTPPPYEESIAPEAQETIQALSKELESLRSSSPEIPLTASDYLAQGDALYFQERFEESLHAYEQAISLQPHLHEAWINKGKALRRLGRFQEALAASTEAATIKPNSPWAWFGRGYALQDLQCFQAAFEAFDRTVQIRPDHYWGWKHRGYALTKLGRYPEARHSFEQALKINPVKAGGTYYWMAYYDLVQGDQDRAIAHLQQALKISPRFREIIKTDPDFDVLRQHPAFQTVIEH
jgi:tetratricopeptide (TPR) repeat protein